MPKYSWYQKKTWSLEDQKDFFAHLQRARSLYNKAQYLRIQAYHFQANASPPNYDAALNLLNRLIEEFPEPSQLGAAYLQKAKCHEKMGQTEQALEAYRSAVKMSRGADGVYNTDAPVHFASLVVKHGIREYYNEVLAAFKGSEMILLLPSAQFMACAAMAIIADETGKKAKASEYAKKALDILGRNSVRPREVDSTIHMRLVNLVSSGTKPWQFWK